MKKLTILNNIIVLMQLRKKISLHCKYTIYLGHFQIIIYFSSMYGINCLQIADEGNVTCNCYKNNRPYLLHLHLGIKIIAGDYSQKIAINAISTITH